jgi:hypothetical protein
VLDIAAAFLDGLGPAGNGNPSVDVLSWPAPITGQFLAKNRLPEAARVAIGLRLLHGETITQPTVNQVAYICKVPRTKLDKHLRKHRNVGAALARAFARATETEKADFIRIAGVESVWHVLTQAI